MRSFEDYIVEQSEEDVFEIYVEGVLSRAASWLGKRAGEAGKWLQKKAADPQSLMGPEGAQRARDIAGGGLQKFGRWVQGAPEPEAEQRKKLPTRDQVAKALGDAKEVLKKLSRNILRSGNPQISAEFRDIYSQLDQVHKVALQKAQAAKKKAQAPEAHKEPSPRHLARVQQQMARMKGASQAAGQRRAG